MADFDPDAYLASKKPAAGFDPGAYLAKRGSAPALEDASGPSVNDKLISEQTAALGVAPSKRHTEFPSSNEIIGNINAAKTDLANAPGPGEVLATNLAQGVPVIGPYSDEMAAAMQAPFSNSSYAQLRDAQRARIAQIYNEHPVASAVIQGAEGAALGGPVFGSAKLPLEVAKRAALVGAAEGAGRSEAPDVVGTLRDAGTNAVLSGATAGITSKVVRGSPERLESRVVKEVARGEAGGATKDKLGKKFVAKAGEGFEDLNEVLSRNPGVEKLLATKAATAPGTVATRIEEKIADAGRKLAPIYKAIDSGPAVPEAQGLFDSLTAVRDRAKAAGSTGMADAIEKFQQHLLKHYGDGDAITQGAKLPASALRNLRKEVAEIAFSGDPTAQTPFKKKAQQLIYGAINDTIEQAASRTPGVDVNQLRQLNKDTSMFLAIKDVLADRSAKAATGRTTLFQNLLGAGMASTAAGAAGDALMGGGGLEGAVTGAVTAGALHLGRKALGAGVRIGDYELAQLVRAARAGSTPAKLGQMAAEYGLSREVGSRLARTIFPNDDVGTQDQPPR